MLTANDAERVQISARYSFLLLLMCRATIAAGRMINSLAQTLFPIKPKPGTRRFFGNDGRPFLHMRKRHTRVTISVSFALR